MSFKAKVPEKRKIKYGTKREIKDISVHHVNTITRNIYIKHIQLDLYTPQWFMLTVKSNRGTLKGHFLENIEKIALTVASIYKIYRADLRRQRSRINTHEKGADDEQISKYRHLWS